MAKKRSLFGLTTVGIVCLAAGLCYADVPSILTSTVEGSFEEGTTYGLDAGRQRLFGTVCPGGAIPPPFPTDMVWISVIVRNVLGQPLVGSPVTVTSRAVVPGDVILWDPGPPPAWDLVPDDPQTGVTGPGGFILFIRDQAGIDWGVPAGLPVVLPNLDFDVWAAPPGGGVPVFLGGLVNQLSMSSPDKRAPTGVVGLPDFGDFAACFGANQPIQIDQRCDYDWNGVTNLIDFGYFAAHWNHKFDDK